MKSWKWVNLVFAVVVANYLKRINQLRYVSFFPSVFLSFVLSKYGHPAIHFSINNLFLSYNNENVRGGVIKAFLVVSFLWNECLFVFVMVLRQWEGRRGVILWCNANRTALTARMRGCLTEGGQRHLVIPREWERPITFITFHILVQFVPNTPHSPTPGGELYKI